MQDDPKEVHDEMLALVNTLNKCNHEYYVLNKPTMADVDYDTLYRKLVDLEHLYPTMKLPNSPTDKVGHIEDIPYGTKVPHVKPMYSLDNVFTKDEVIAWVKKFPAGTEFWCDVKLDGVALEVVYHEDTFVRAVTRGDGQVGTVVNHVTDTMSTLPKTLLTVPDEKYTFTALGEVIVYREYLKEINAELKNTGGRLYANSRSLASALLNTKDTRFPDGRSPLHFCVHSISQVDPPHTTHNEDIEYAIDTGLVTIPYGDRFDTVESILAFIDNCDHGRANMPFEIDGVVIKVNDKALQQELGYTAKSPRWAVAYKFSAEEKTTRVKAITVQVGPGGSVSPVAVLYPAAVINGVNVNMVSLHNSNYITAKDIRVNDYVRVRRAGDVIPEIVGVVHELRPDNTVPFVYPTTCPSCRSTLVIQGGTHRCTNSACDATSMMKIIHFVSKAGLNIDGLGTNLITRMYEQGVIADVADLLSLNVNVLMDKMRLTLKSAAKIVTNISTAKSQATLEKMLTSLSIRHTSKGTARRLCAVYSSIEEIMHAEVSALSAITDIGPQTAEAIYDYFHTDKNIKLVRRLMELGLNPIISTREVSNHPLAGTVVVFSGVFTGMTRDELTNKASALGIVATNNVSSKVKFLVTGASPSAGKLNKAIKLGITVMDQNTFLRSIGVTA